MRTKILAAALFATSALAAPAFAQDAASDPTFTGPRAEAVVGWDRVDEKNAGSRDGVVYGGQIGYDFQSGNTVFGIEGEATGATTKDTIHGYIAPNDRAVLKAGRDLYVGGRIGFVAGSDTLVYAKAGYTNAKFINEYRAGTTTFHNSGEVDGWRLGAGVEKKLSDKIYAKAEYRFSKYEDDSRAIDAKRHQVLAGVGVRF